MSAFQKDKRERDGESQVPLDGSEDLDGSWSQGLCPCEFVIGAPKGRGPRRIGSQESTNLQSHSLSVLVVTSSTRSSLV
jgi:hypothetical protein